MHAGGQLRDPFIEWLESVEKGSAEYDDQFYEDLGGERHNIGQLLGELQNCTDILPGDLRDQLDMAQSSTGTFAAAVRIVRQYR